jgi:SAM-dependent methyltransferase
MNSKYQLQDAFGQALWDFYKNRKVTTSHVIERDDGYIDTPQSLGMEQYFLEYPNWGLIEKEAIKHAKGKILDIGCGAGRHSLYLQNKNHNVLAIDNSPLTIRVAKSRGVKHAKVLSFENIGKLKQSKFDTIIMFGNNFGLFGNFKKARKQLKILHDITSLNGIIIATTINPYKTKSIEHKEYHKYNRKKGNMGGQAKIRIRYKKITGPWFDYLLVSQSELKMILSGTGWMIKKIIEEKSGLVYGMVLGK